MEVTPTSQTKVEGSSDQKPFAIQCFSFLTQKHIPENRPPESFGMPLEGRFS